MKGDVRYQNWLRVREPSEPTMMEIIITVMGAGMVLGALLLAAMVSLIPEQTADMIQEVLR